jgi:hypothetical protein
MQIFFSSLLLPFSYIKIFPPPHSLFQHRRFSFPSSHFKDQVSPSYKMTGKIRSIVVTLNVYALTSQNGAREDKKKKTVIGMKSSSDSPTVIR